MCDGPPFRHGNGRHSMSAGILIVGAGLAAQRCCEALRARGFEGVVRMVGDEQRPPYDRPPLSKGVLTGERDPATLGFRDPAWYRDNRVELLLGERAVALDPGIKTVTLASGATLDYDSVVVATGSRPRPLPGTEAYANTHLLRSADDAVRLRDALGPGVRLITIGAGFIGLEVAATARQAGADVTVLEAAPAPLMRVLTPELASWFVDLHRAEGVEVLLGAHVARFGEGPAGAEWVQLTDGRRLECDALAVGIGVVPATEWLEGSGLDPEGVRVDSTGFTGIPDVFAAGDAARAPNPLTGIPERCEQWEAAARQGVQVARTILGLDATPPALPSFWTDQYGHRIQLVGDAREADAIEIDGDREAGKFSALLSRDGLPVAGMAVDQPRSIPAMRRSIQAAQVNPERRPDEVRATN